MAAHTYHTTHHNFYYSYNFYYFYNFYYSYNFYFYFLNFNYYYNYYLLPTKPTNRQMKHMQHVR